MLLEFEVLTHLHSFAFLLLFYHCTFFRHSFTQHAPRAAHTGRSGVDDVSLLGFGMSEAHLFYERTLVDTHDYARTDGQAGILSLYGEKIQSEFVAQDALR